MGRQYGHQTKLGSPASRWPSASGRTDASASAWSWPLCQGCMCAEKDTASPPAGANKPELLHPVQSIMLLLVTLHVSITDGHPTCWSTCLLAGKAAAAQDDHKIETKCRAGKLNTQTELWLQSSSKDLIGMRLGHIPGDDKL